MNKAISNIAWTPSEDDRVYDLMLNNGFHGLEVAPGKLFDDPYNQPQEKVKARRAELEAKGLKIIAMQALLFGHPELTIFADTEVRKQTAAYLSKAILFAELLGATALVFGSPKNRLIGNSPRQTVATIAADFFGELAETAAEHNTVLCIEPNPAAYGGDYILTTPEALALVKSVDHPGLKVQLDIGALVMNHEDPKQTIELALPFVGHCHISEPNLAPVGAQTSDHVTIAAVLKESAYSGWISIEMKAVGTDNLATVETAIKFVNEVYV